MKHDEEINLKEYFDAKFDVLERATLATAAVLERVTSEKASVLAASPTIDGAKLDVLETKIDAQTAILAGQTNILQAYFGPEGICLKERMSNASSNSNTRAHIKGLWATVTFLVATLVTIGIDLLRKL